MSVTLRLDRIEQELEFSILKGELVLCVGGVSSYFYIEIRGVQKSFPYFGS